MKRILSALAVTSTLALGMAGTAGTAAAATTGDQLFIIFGQGEDAATLTAVGPVSGVGVDIESEDGDHAVFEFDGGSIGVFHPADSDDFTFNPRTCVGRDRFTGTYTLTSGTGAYAGISGSGTYRGWAIFVAKRLADGSCSEEDAPIVNSFFVRAVGTTTLK